MFNAYRKRWQFSRRVNALRKKYQDEGSEALMQILERIVFAYKFHGNRLPFYVEVTCYDPSVKTSNSFFKAVRSVARELNFNCEYFSLYYSANIYRGSFRFF